LLKYAHEDGTSTKVVIVKCLLGYYKFITRPKIKPGAIHKIKNTKRAKKLE